MKTQHTPGPWKIGAKLGIYCKNLGTMIANCDHTTNFPEENLANARLIAAAPDLLAALRQVRIALYSGADLSETFECRCDDRENGYICLGHQIEKAINKAKG